MKFLFEVAVETKNDQLTHDLSRAELAELVMREMTDALMVLPWVIDHHVVEWVPKTEEDV